MPIDRPRTPKPAQNERKPTDAEVRTVIARDKIERELERLRKELAERDVIIAALKSIEGTLSRNGKRRPKAAS